MNRIITLDTEEAFSKEEIEQVAAKYSFFLQGKVLEAFRTAERKEYEKAAKLCCEILDCEVQPEIMMLLGTCYFVQGHMESAEMVFNELVQMDSQNQQGSLYLGMTKHALGKVEEAVELLGQLYPLENYHPFYYSSYGDSLQGIGRLKQSRDVFYEEIAYFKKTGVIFSPVMLDGVFQNVLYLDVTLGNGQYPEDVKTYYDFLDQIEMTEEMQECLAGNIVHFCSLMSNKWYRPLFLKFITHIQEKGYLEGGAFQETMDSAFSSWESYQYHEDRNIGVLMEDYLSAWHEEKFLEPEFYSEDEISTIKVKALAYQWYMCQYLPEHLEEAYYVRETYPHTYAGIKEFIEKVEADAAGTAEQLLDALMPYSHGSTRQKLEAGMREAYRRACEVQKNPAYVYDGEDTYRRMQPKVGRNDPCPCGSGKKYKKCCGK